MAWAYPPDAKDLRVITWIGFLIFLAATACAEEIARPFDILVFTKTEGYRHASIPDGVAALEELGQQRGFRVAHTEDARQFTADNLARYRAVVFLNTSGDVLDASQKTAFERYIQRGGGFVGIHGASNTEYDWPWYGRLVGAYFDRHPKVQPASLSVVDAAHISTRGLPNPWRRRDEWYDFHSFPDRVRVLITVDESSYEGGAMGDPHPISWYHMYDGGRAWYTAMGHTPESYREPFFLQHLLGGILWAAGLAE